MPPGPGEPRCHLVLRCLTSTRDAEGGVDNNSQRLPDEGVLIVLRPCRQERSRKCSFRGDNVDSAWLMKRCNCDHSFMLTRALRNRRVSGMARAATFDAVHRIVHTVSS